MAKRGQKNHLKRIAVPRSLAISNKKDSTWISKPRSGPHNAEHSISLSILLRDILRVCENNKEARRILNKRIVKVDGRVRTDEKFPVGLFDVISVGESVYGITCVKHAKLVPVELDKDPKQKIAKVTGKYSVKKGAIMIALHDGKTIKADNNVKVGDSVVISLPDYKVVKVLKMQDGARCLVKGGKHAGALGKLNKLVTNAGRKEASVSVEKEEFVTVADHLCVVDDSFKGAKQ